MHSPEFLNIAPELILPNDSEQMRKIKQKLNEIIQRLDEAYRFLHMDVRVMDMRELPPHAGIDHASWKWVESSENGDLKLYHRSGDTWSDSGWSVIGDLTRRPTVG